MIDNEIYCHKEGDVFINWNHDIIHDLHPTFLGENLKHGHPALHNICTMQIVAVKHYTQHFLTNQPSLSWVWIWNMAIKLYITCMCKGTMQLVVRYSTFLCNPLLSYIIKHDYMTKQVVHVLRLCSPQFDTKFTTKQQRLAKIDTILWFKSSPI